jgi:hypothetical protein
MGLHNIYAPTVESFLWAPDLQDSGDMEAGTKTISAVARPDVADYTCTLTIAPPPAGSLGTPSVFTPYRTVSTISLTILNWTGGGAVLNYETMRGGVVLSSGSYVGSYTGSPIVRVQTTLSPSGAVPYEIRFWVDAGTVDLTLVQVTEAIGMVNAVPADMFSVILFNKVGTYLFGAFIIAKSGGTATGQVVTGIDIGTTTSPERVILTTTAAVFSRTPIPIPAGSSMEITAASSLHAAWITTVSCVVQS